MHQRIENMLERFGFRRPYRIATTLRRCAEECVFGSDIDSLFELGVERIARHTQAPHVPLYERDAAGDVCRRQTGEAALAQTVGRDDLAFVAFRTGNVERDLNGVHSVLGRGGYAYPLVLRGELQGAVRTARAAERAESP